MSAVIAKSYGLTKAQLTDIRQLETVCNQFEGLTMKLNWATLHDRPSDQTSDFLVYTNGQLVGYLALFCFNQQEAEVSAMIHPAYRRRGIFTRLLAAARAELQARHIPHLLFICEQSSTAGALCMQAITATYEFSEYKMRCVEPVTLREERPALQLRPAQPEDIAELIGLDEICFGVSGEAAQQWLARDLADPQRKILLAALGPLKIGKINVWLSETETFIAGFCIWPEYRRQGYGKVILARTLEQLVAEQHTNIVLEVACENEQALTLYQHCGFRTVTAYDYYRLAVS